MNAPTTMTPALCRALFAALTPGNEVPDLGIVPGQIQRWVVRVTDAQGAALEHWVARPGNHFFCDTRAAAGAVSGDFWARENVHCVNASSGRTKQAFVLLSQKVLANLKAALEA